MTGIISMLEVFFVAKGEIHTAISSILISYPDSKLHGANMGPIWGRQDPGGPHVGPVNLTIWVFLLYDVFIQLAYSYIQM